EYTSNGGTLVVEYSRPEGGPGRGGPGGPGGGPGGNAPAAQGAQATTDQANAAPAQPAAGGRGGGRGGRAGGRGAQAQTADGQPAPPPPPPPRGPVAPEIVDATGFLEHIGPYPIHIANDRVTVEEAPIAFPNPSLALLHAPNEITQADFEGWIQER